MTRHPLLSDDGHSVTSTMVAQTGIHLQVQDWRKTEFMRLGFAEHDALALAVTRIDTHDMERLLKKGCSHELAWRILMGTMWNGPDPLWVDSSEGGYMDIPLVDRVSEYTEDEDDGA